MTQSARLYLFLCAAATVLVSIVVARHALPFGWPAVWTWEYKPLEASRFVPCALAAAVIAALLPAALKSGLSDSDALSRGLEMRRLAALWLGCVALSVTLMLMHPRGLMHPATLVVNPASNSYYTTALAHPDAGELLNGYDLKMKSFASHAQTQSAGPVVMCIALRKIYAALPFSHELSETLFSFSPGFTSEAIAKRLSQVWRVNLTPQDAGAALFIALCTTGIGALGVVPIYLLGKWLHDAPTGWCAALFFALLPSLHLFYGAVDVMYPFAAAGTLCLLLQATRETRRAALWMALAGAWLSLWIVMNMGLITLVPLGILFWMLRPNTRTMRDNVLGLAFFGLGIFLPWLLLRLFFGYDLWRVFLASNAMRDSLYYNARSYPQSLPANVTDFFVFAGVPLFGLFAWRVAREVRAWRNVGSSRDMSTHAGAEAVAESEAIAEASQSQARRSLSDVWGSAPLLWALLAVLLALDLSGRVRGEAARMWMFLLPCVVVAAAPLARDLWRQKPAAFVLTVALQAAQILIFQFYVRVWGY